MEEWVNGEVKMVNNLIKERFTHKAINTPRFMPIGDFWRMNDMTFYQTYTRKCKCLAGFPP